MAEHFDELTKDLASGVSRRDALKRFVGGIFGGLLAAVGLTKTAGAQAPGTCPAYCRSLGINPGNGNAFGKCVSNCSNCRLAGGTECGASGCCHGNEVCQNGTCVVPHTCNTCDVNTPCNSAIPCEGNGNCNCWVRSDKSGCWCGPLDPCANHQPCGPGDSCPDGQVCIENCCGKLCYAGCGA